MFARQWHKILAALLLAAVASNPCPAQVAPGAVLELEAENVVRYYEDTADSSRFGTLPGVTPATVGANFQTYVLIGDIVAINGQPVRGTISHTARWTNLTPTPKPGESIADMIRGGLGQWSFEILNTDGTPIGTIFLAGMHGGTRTPGSPLQVTQGNNTIIGGTGAFIGVRGDFGQQVSSSTVAVRSASMMEDPSRRRINGGGKIRWVFRLIPLTTPQIVTSSGRPAVFHADFSPVSATNPAAAGEMLILQATGLGPTVPGVNPGDVFPADRLQLVSAPVAASVDGQKAEVINSVGWPGLVDTYRVDIRVPVDVKAGSAIQLSSAWIPGPAVPIPLQ